MLDSREGISCSDAAPAGPGSVRVVVVDGPGGEWERFEADLRRAGVPLPMTSRAAFVRLRQNVGARFVAVTDASGRCVGGFALEISRSRALPGHVLLRAERVGDNLPPSCSRAAIEVVARQARENSRVLRLNVGVHARDDAARRRLADDLAACGFAQLTEIRSYTHTIAIDLVPDQEQIFASFSQGARRKIRQVEKLPLSVRPIDDLSLAGRMNELLLETYDRTGGDPPEVDWAVPMQMSRVDPAASRLLGVFDDQASGPASLLAYAWGCGHGGHAHYSVSASTRHTSVKAPLTYALIWELMLWAKGAGCAWFDLGGISRGTYGSDDPVGGISDFKRSFNKDVIEVGQEWALEPHPLRSRIVAAVSAGARLVQRARGALLRQKRPLAQAAATLGTTGV